LSSASAFALASATLQQLLLLQLLPVRLRTFSATALSSAAALSAASAHLPQQLLQSYRLQQQPVRLPIEEQQLPIEEQRQRG
jgi:hypothetical protein